jgi:hypothetical protein
MYTKHTVKPGNYLYKRKSWDTSLSCKVFTLTDNELYVKFKSGYRSSLLRNFPEDGKFVKCK